ncbi:MAG: hypothetical protein CMK42_00795 [Porticoccaceae bacterium]|nr:hypothetical protein [Porticoccaceae bacterium]
MTRRWFALAKTILKRRRFFEWLGFSTTGPSLGAVAVSKEKISIGGNQEQSELTSSTRLT